eukprot:1123949-Prymnesium_polylepis.1
MSGELRRWLLGRLDSKQLVAAPGWRDRHEFALDAARREASDTRVGTEEVPEYAFRAAHRNIVHTLTCTRVCSQWL